MRRKVKSLVGKYVCYGNENGGFRWGKISSESSINTADGMKEAFVLEGNMSCPKKGGPIQRHNGPRLLTKDTINLESDIIDDSGNLETFGDEELFRVSLGDMSVLGLGASNMAEAEVVFDGKETVADKAADILKERMGV